MGLAPGPPRSSHHSRRARYRGLDAVRLPSSPRYVALEDSLVRVRLGWPETRFPRAHIVAAQRVHGGWRWSIGWHIGFVGTRALVVNGSWAGMVELRIEPPLVSRSLRVPISCSCVRLSLQEPDAFLAALGSLGTGPDS